MKSVWEEVTLIFHPCKSELSVGKKSVFPGLSSEKRRELKWVVMSPTPTRNVASLLFAYDLNEEAKTGGSTHISTKFHLNWLCMTQTYQTKCFIFNWSTILSNQDRRICPCKSPEEMTMGFRLRQWKKYISIVRGSAGKRNISSFLFCMRGFH